VSRRGGSNYLNVATALLQSLDESVRTVPITAISVRQLESELISPKLGEHCTDHYKLRLIITLCVRILVQHGVPSSRLLCHEHAVHQECLS
jgi:hypothetical protein